MIAGAMDELRVGNPATLETDVSQMRAPRPTSSPCRVVM